MIRQSVLLCSACVGVSLFVTLFFLRGGLGFDDKGVGVGGDREAFCGRMRWNHRRQL